MKNIRIILALMLALLGGRAWAQRDVTSQYITNATLSDGTNGWTVSNFNSPVQGNNTTGYASEAYAGWNALNITSYSLKQDITLPAGNFRLVNYSFFRQGIAYDTDNTKSLCNLIAGDQSVAIKTLGSITAAGYANSQAEGANAFDSKMYRNQVDITIPEGGKTITIGLDGTFDAAYSWCIAGMFELYDMDQTPTEATPTDMTYAITNSGFEYRDLTGWTLSSDGALAAQSNTAFDNKAGGYYCETWQASGGLSDRSISQTLTDLPAGYYTLKAYSYYGGTGAKLFANDAETEITSGTSGQYSVKKKISTGGSLNIGLKLESGTSNWVCVDRFTLSYYPVDLTSLKEKFATLKEEAESLYGQNMDETVLAALKSAANASPAEDEDSYLAANETLQSAIEAAKTAIEDYIYDHASNTQPGDVTSKITNPDYEAGTTGWTVAQNQTGDGSLTVTDVDGNKVYQSTYNTYMHHESVYQEGITLRAGSYRLSARVKGTPRDDESTFIYATDGTVSHWSSPTFGGNAWCSYLKRVSGSEWATLTTSFTLTQQTTIRIGIISWGNNYTGGQGGAFCVDDWKLELLSYPEVKHILGDATGNGEVSVRDVTELVSALSQGNTNILYDGADANNDGSINTQDVTPMVDIILKGEKTKVAGLAEYDMTIYAEQKSAENAAGTNYMINGTVNVDASSATIPSEAFTTLKITVSAPTSVSRISVYAKGHEAIAGNMHFVTRDKSFTTSDGAVPSYYAGGMSSDVVNLVGDAQNGVYTIYLLPNQLASGITVTVEDGSSNFYSQDFDITAGAENALTFSQSTASNLWMSTLPGNTYYSFISTPGAHDAATSGCTSFTYLAKCQYDDLSTLLANGVRAFDLRPGYYYTETISADNLYIYHGQVNTNVKYVDAIKIFVDFLKAHPSETISIIMVKENNKPSIDLFNSYTDRSEEMWSVMNACHSEYSDYMKLLDHSYYTLDDFRGKICYVNRNATDCTNTVCITGWSDKAYITTYTANIAGVCPTNIEDAYEDDDDTKKTHVEGLLQTASNNTDKSHMHYTYASIAGSTSSSLTAHAGVMNPYTASYIGTLTGPVGYVYADVITASGYSGPTLIKAVVNQNYKYVFKGRSRK